MKTFKTLIEEISSEMNESVADAIEDLVDQIKHDGYSKGMEDYVADEYEVNVGLLKRLFKQKYGKEPGEMSISNSDEKVVAAAKRKAAESRSRFSGSLDKYVGKIFLRQNKKYVFVAWTGKDIHCITIPDQREIYLRFANIKSAQSYLVKNII